LTIWLIFFLFLRAKPSVFPLFAGSQLDISAISDSVSAVSEDNQLNYCWSLKLVSGPRIFKLLNFVWYPTYQYTQAAYVFVPSVFGENIPTAEFGMIWAETACWDIESK
jgi:hypothetical protein